MLERALSVVSNKDRSGQWTVVGDCEEVFSSRPDASISYGSGSHPRVKIKH